ncbi:KAP family P-loop NTPase fold protein [Pedobacter xixiisoli]|uniref:KAP family P-loop domain-containing protein n=1 Tax=Pedobacter xixiisoli TaxID=1476464 RepID=A0A285ZXG7_9SPHI|nr:P-loop NTPase fold protein [Pedobacter xixiisoli]SOD14328.1 KAP family P-loop domain-containing protein [Pedobacter xixiisoli]
MKIKHHEIEIPEENPFVNCKLEREPYAKVLTSIVNTYADGFVLAINNEWGTGKTTFVKMWQQQLKNESFQTIYFNAWENDFDSNPLVAIMSELKTLTKADNKEIFKSVVEKGAVLAKNVVPALAKSLIKKYVVDIDDISLDAIENATKGATELLEEQIKDYANKKKTIHEFRTELEKFIQKSDNNKPLVFIIDELDRCRPTYAVEILEQLKHFFSVAGIVFVLSIDKKHLASSVKGYYRSTEINTDEYLRRFIDLEYTIPIPPQKAFSNYLFEYYGFDEFFLSSGRSRFPDFREDGNALLKMAETLFTTSNATLRQQEKVFGQTRLILKSFNSDQYTFAHLMFFLVYLKTMKLEDYSKIDRNVFSLQELSDLFASLMPTNVSSYGINFIYVQALLLYFYNNNREYQNRETLYEKDNEGKFVSLINAKLENKRSTLGDCFKHINEQWNFNDGSLKYLLSRINLTEPILMQ